jgi:hypothetical protein
VDLQFLPAPELTGGERIVGTNATVLDFWKFAMGDLRINNVRGYLAEFLVAQAVGADTARVEWDPRDVTAPDGTRIEVKSSAYLQAWAQTKLSVPTFRVTPTRAWDEVSGKRSVRTFNADVYVFCLHTARSHQHYNPLATNQWEFYVASRTDIESRKGQQMGLATLATVAGEPVGYEDLRARILATAGRRPLPQA